jgi:hypothetical protein
MRTIEPLAPIRGPLICAPLSQRLGALPVDHLGTSVLDRSRIRRAVLQLAG